MKIRQGFVSNSSTSSYIYLVASFEKEPSESALNKIKEMGFLYFSTQNHEEQYFASQVYEGYDDCFYLTEFEKVEEKKKAYLDVYAKMKDDLALGPIQYANDVAYDQHWLVEAREYDQMMEEENEDKD